MAEIQQSIVKKTLILSTRHICSVTPITSAHVSSFCCQVAVQFSSLRSMISFEQWKSAIGFFSPIVCCELNINAKTCKHDVTHFISFVPVWLFHFVSGSFTDAVSNNILCESHEMSVVHPKHAFIPFWIAVQYEQGFHTLVHLHFFNEPTMLGNNFL